MRENRVKIHWGYVIKKHESSGLGTLVLTLSKDGGFYAATSTAAEFKHKHEAAAHFLNLGTSPQGVYIEGPRGALYSIDAAMKSTPVYR